MSGRGYCKLSVTLRMRVGEERRMNLMDQFDEPLHLESSGAPESIAIASSGRAQLKRAPEMPPHRFREVLVLREILGVFPERDFCDHFYVVALAGPPSTTVGTGQRFGKGGY